MRLALVPAGFAAGAALSRIAIARSPQTYAADLAQPLIVVTYWQHFGFTMWLALLAAIVIASAGYIAVLCRANPYGVSVIASCSALAAAAALAFPAVFSSDVYAYAGYGWMASHGISPYSHTALGARNPLIDSVVWQWGNPPPVCVYGPAFVWFAQLVVSLFGALGPAAPLWALRIASCAALVACAPLAFAAFPERARSAAAAGIALNPIAIWSCAEGHNDVYVIAIVLAGLALIRRARFFTGAALVALSALVKLPGVLAAAAAAIVYARDRRVIGGIAAGVIVCALAGAPALLQVTHGSNGGHAYFPQFSAQYVLTLLFGATAGIALTITLVATCAIAGTLYAWHGKPGGFALLALALWLTIPNPYPWYALWILPLAFAEWPGAAGWAIVALSLASVVRYLPDATTDLSSAASGAIVAVSLAVPIAALAIAKSYPPQKTVAFGPPGKPAAGP